jgi:hypothetical protein
VVTGTERALTVCGNRSQNKRNRAQMFLALFCLRHGGRVWKKTI